MFAPAMSTPQYQRVERMYNEPLYLINVENDALQYRVTGSTGNLYTVKINIGVDNILDVLKCDCPDARMHAQRNGVLCKHCCYVLLKVLRLPEIFIVRNVPDNELLLTHVEQLRSRTWSHLSNAEYQHKYQSLLNGNNTTSSPFDVAEDAQIEDVCVICLDDMTPQECSRCPGCRNYMHQDCIKIWLRARTSANISRTCPLCRYSWANYQQATSISGVKSVSGFVNLA